MATASEDVLATITEMRGEVSAGAMPDDALYGLMCDATEYMACDSATAREITRVTMAFLKEIGYPNVVQEAPRVFTALCRNCDTEKLIAIGDEFDADEQLWQSVVALILTDCIEHEFTFDSNTYDKLIGMCISVGIPAPRWSDSRVCVAAMVEIARHSKSCGIAAGAALVSDWCDEFVISMIEFVATAEPHCTDIDTAEDDLEPAAVAYVGDCIVRKITREQMLAELDAAGLRNNRWIGEEALKKYGESVLNDHRNKLDGGSFVSVVQIFALAYPDALTSDTVRDCAQRNVEMGSMTIEADDHDLAPYGLCTVRLALGAPKSFKSSKAYVPHEIPTLDQSEIEIELGGDLESDPVDNWD